jgi:hypothetical protein
MCVGWNRGWVRRSALTVLYVWWDCLLHSGEFGGGTAGDLLDTQLAELGLEFVELLAEVLFGLAPELGGLDAGGGRLFIPLVGHARDKCESSYHFGGRMSMSLSVVKNLKVAAALGLRSTKSHLVGSLACQSWQLLSTNPRKH